MKSTIYLVDFNDSFTYQIYSELKKINSTLNIIVMDSYELLALSNVEGSFIIGPGPGHPRDYIKYFPKLQEILNHPNNRVLGICLGHQLIWNIAGYEVKQSNSICHGDHVSYNINSKLTRNLGIKSHITVQRYNSLAVKYNKLTKTNLDLSSSLIEGGELIIGKASNIISFQFHPESIGTKDTPLFFKRFLEEICH